MAACPSSGQTHRDGGKSQTRDPNQSRCQDARLSRNNSLHPAMSVLWWRDRETERDRGRERQGDREGERDRETRREGDRERRREAETERLSMGAESPQNAGRPRPLPLRHPRLGLAPTSWRNLAIRGPCRPDSEREASWRLSSRVAPLQDPSCQPLREPRAPDPEAFWSCLYSTLPGVSEAEDPSSHS